MALAPYRFLELPESIDRLGDGWAKVAGGFSQIIGYTLFGDFFLRDPQTGEHAILVTMYAEVEATGYTDATEFATLYLNHPAIVEWLAKTELAADIEDRFGPAGDHDVYIPVPYPFLGGSGKADTYEKGDVWIFAAIVGQYLIRDA